MIYKYYVIVMIQSLNLYSRHTRKREYITILRIPKQPRSMMNNINQHNQILLVNNCH